MTNFKSDHNGYQKIPINQLKLITCNYLYNSSSTISNFKKLFPCNICFILLFIIQISSTCLMLISVGLSFKMISAEVQLVNQSTKFIKNLILNSGNISTTNQTNNIETNRDFYRLFLHRSRRLSDDLPMDFSLILTRDTIRSICKTNYLVNRFKYLSRVKLRYCDIFHVSSVIYSILVSEFETVNMSFSLFPFDYINPSLDDIPTIMLRMLENGYIAKLNNSLHKIIDNHFSTEGNCINVLNRLLEEDNRIESDVKRFVETLLKNHCIDKSEERNSSVIFCQDCEMAYKKWLCTNQFDIYISLTLPNSNSKSESSESENLNKNSKTQSALIGIKSCPEWCSTVETECPYFTPIDGNGGEPAFLCDESHYHHNARYRLNANASCGADMPWNYCCYSAALLSETQNTSNYRIFSQLYPNTSSDTNQKSCVSEQKSCLYKLIQSFYHIKNYTFINNSLGNNNNNENSFQTNPSNSHAVSISELSNNQLQIMICISSSFFLYFYMNFSVR